MIKTVPSSEIAKNFGEWHDVAVREPVAVTRYGRASVVLVSADRYRSLVERADHDAVDRRRIDRTNKRGTRLFSPHQILLAYSNGEIDSGLAMRRLGLDHYRQLAIAMSDAELALPGTSDDELANQALVAIAAVTRHLKGTRGA